MDLNKNMVAFVRALHGSLVCCFYCEGWQCSIVTVDGNKTMITVKCRFQNFCLIPWTYFGISFQVVRNLF